MDDPYADAEWEEIEAVEASEAVVSRNQVVDGTARSADIGPSIESSHGTTTTTNVNELALEHEPQLEPHLLPISDDSEYDINDATADIHNLDISEPDLPLRSHSLSAPVDIPSGRNSTSRNADGSGNPDRTPSPTARTPANHLTDILAGPEGPMTPTNDAGPYVFDGSAGRELGARAALNAFAERTSEHTST